MSNQWIPPGFRTCTWDEAQRMSKNGEFRCGISSDGRVDSLSEEYGTEHGADWLCIDTEPKHTHKPWVAMGFEECNPDESPMGNRGGRLAWGDTPTGLLFSSHGASNFIKPSPLPGLKRALELLTVLARSDSYFDAALNLIEREIAKYEPQVCGECGRVKP